MCRNRQRAHAARVVHVQAGIVDTDDRHVRLGPDEYQEATARVVETRDSMGAVRVGMLRIARD